MHRADSSANRAPAERADRLQREADLLIAQGHYARAEPLYREASTLLLSVFGSSHYRYAQSVNKLALAYLAMGRYREATMLHQQVLDISLAVGGEGDPLYLRSLINLATVHRAAGRFVEAEKVYRQAVDIHKKSLNKDPAAVASALTDLAWIYAATAREPEALIAISAAEAYHDQMISNVASRGSERDQRACVESVRGGYYLFVSLVLRYFPDSPDAPGVLLEIIFRRKALGIEMSLARRVASMCEHKPSIN